MKRPGFCIFINTVFEGAIPSLRGNLSDDRVNARNGIWIFRTGLEAQREIADGMMTRLQEFLDGEGNCKDAITAVGF